MRKTKVFLAQFIIEVDVTDKPGFDHQEARSYFLSSLRLAEGDKKIDLTVYPLAAKPELVEDEELESYEYRGFQIEILQVADSVGTDFPSYYAAVASPNAKNASESIVGAGSEDIEEVKRLAQKHVDKRVAQMEKRNSKK